MALDRTITAIVMPVDPDNRDWARKIPGIRKAASLARVTEFEGIEDMALTRFGFIVAGTGLDATRNRMVMKAGNFEMIAIGVGRASDGPAAAKALVEDGVQLIELCGAFGPIWTAKVIEAIDAKVPVGYVGYGPEAITQMHKLFE